MLVALESSLPKSRRRCGKETNAENCKRSRSPALIPHLPYTTITAAIFISLRWGPTDVQVCVWRTGEHYQGALVPHHGGKTSGLRIEWPKDHPVRTDGDRRASRVERIASIQCGKSRARDGGHTD